jgi:hypothetical protein
MRTYSDFVLVAGDVQKDQAGRVRQFSVRVFTSPVGEGQKAEIVAIPGGLFTRLGRLEARGLDQDAAGQAELGEQLGRLLLPPYARGLLQRSMADRAGNGLRLRLRLADELADFPWEYIYVPDARGERTSSGYLALDPDISIVRHEAVEAPTDLTESDSLRVVVTMASPQPYETYPRLANLPTEQQAIKGALAGVAGIQAVFLPAELGEETPGATWPGLVAALQQAQTGILHFSGHGEFDARGPAFGSITGQGSIILANEHNQADVIGADRLAEQVRRQGVKLAVLGACETGRRENRNVWSSVAASLLKAGIPAVVAMQFTVDDKLAATFMAAFYRSLVAGMTVDEAVARGRLAMRAAAAGSQRDVRDWGAPVLYLREATGRIFNPVTNTQARNEAEQKLGRGIRDASPYRFLSPYTAADRSIFRGREHESDSVTRLINDQQVVVVYGPANVGKTSLMAAAVAPSLSDAGHLCATVAEYNQPLHSAASAARALAGQVGLALPATTALADLLHSLVTSSDRLLVMIFDQFERVFDATVDDSQRSALISALVQARQSLGGERLRLVFVVREEALGRLWNLQQELPDLAQSSFRLLPLDDAHAAAALIEPLHIKNDPVTIDEDFVAHRLVADLNALTPDTPGIQPALLQIVASTLYEKALRRTPRHIDAVLYDQEKGAQGIVATYIERTLAEKFVGDEGLARRLLLAMTSPQLGRWVRPDQLSIDGAPQERIYDVMERLVEAELLTPRSVDGQRVYAFASERVKQKILEKQGSDALRRLRAGEELERAWSAWLTPDRDALASRGQLRYLARFGTDLNPGPERALLLLRSALAHNEPTAVWRHWLGSNESRMLIEQIEAGTAPAPGGDSDSLMHVRRLLDLGARALAPLPANHDGFGPVAWAAVVHPDPIVRQTNALALAALGGRQVINRLGAALFAGVSGYPRKVRANELRAVLADADPAIESIQPRLAESSAVWTWVWRGALRIQRDIPGLLIQAAGGAVGTGLALGLMRGLIAIVLNTFPATQFAIYYWWGAILGASAALAMALAASLPTGATPTPARAAALRAALLGAIGFGAGHVAVLFFNNPTSLGLPLPVSMGFAVGIGLATALFGQPQAGLRLGLRSWLARLGVAAVVGGAVQATFLYAQNQGPGIAIAWGVRYYRDNVSRVNEALAQQLASWWEWIAVLDAALAAVMMTIGIAVGMVVAADWLARWRRTLERAGD